jgi:hypothetical protein
MQLLIAAMLAGAPALMRASLSAPATSASLAIS